ncbi:cytochrome P450 [Amycolatopsis thailandensis]|uniref:Cytochrome P450 n=1 Tax=Amycolatopsis thailandensis TaxID=589330 RepID=A0A229S533_9PSEU|nr:cytochrome P450 [Amycolatopsis thailandensis]OXM53990.1 cytochrome P450 [Amycolatopsis thailandensis]
MTITSESSQYRLGDAPGRIPVLGNALKIFKDPLTYLPRLRDQGDVVRVRLGPGVAYMAVTHDVVQEVLHRPRVFDKGGEFIDKMRVILGDGVGTCSVTTHKRQRAFIQPAFQKHKITGYTEVMAKHVADLVGSWRFGQEIDVLEEMSKLTTRVTAQAMFSDDDLGAEAIAEVQRSFPVVWKGVFRRMMLPLPVVHEVPTKANQDYRQALARLEGVINSMVNAYREDGREHDDILSVLLAARDEDGTAMTDLEIRDELMTILAAGVETPASGLAWALYLTSTHPDVEAKLHEEVDSVLNTRTATPDDYPRLPYTNRIVNEALRMYPPVWFITRRAVVDTTLGGHHVPAGSSILFSPYALHRDPAVFAAPNTFDPDRWLPERLRELPKNAVISFSGGSRKCLGDVLANHEMTIALASIAARWRLREKAGHQLKPVPKAELTIGHMPMTVEPRGTRKS